MTGSSFASRLLVASFSSVPFISEAAHRLISSLSLTCTRARMSSARSSVPFHIPSVPSDSSSPSRSDLVSSIPRLHSHIQSRIAAADRHIARSAALISEYERVISQCRRLPQSLSHPVMVPFGRRAFQRGKIVHTNQFLVLLGANYFVSCSAHQAESIAKRRIGVLNDKIERLKVQRTNFEEELKGQNMLFGQQYNEEGEPIVEIKEEYYSDEEDGGGEDQYEDDDDDVDVPMNRVAGQNKQETGIKLIETRTPANNTKSSASDGGSGSGSHSLTNSIMSQSEFDDYWDRLEELEALEEEREALLKVAAQPDGDDEKAPLSLAAINLNAESKASSNAASAPSAAAVPRTPAELFNLIPGLRNESTKTQSGSTKKAVSFAPEVVDNSPEPVKRQPPTPAASASTAFTGRIVEKGVVAPQPAATPAAAEAEPPKVSKFKLARMNK